MKSTAATSPCSPTLTTSSTSSAPPQQAFEPAPHQAGHRLVGLIADNPFTLDQMTSHLPAAGSYAPVTVLIQELPGGGTRVPYNTVPSAIAP
jgi:hypothetical protein